MHTTDTARQELDAQRDLVRRPRKRIAALAVAAGITVALTVPGAVVFADGVGSTNAGFTATETAASSDSTTPGYKKNQVVYVKTDADGNRTASMWSTASRPTRASRLTTPARTAR